ncbi:MAG: phytanoyl-CoA dioxygenase family protein, partial [Nitrospinales bacterium]
KKKVNLDSFVEDGFCHLGKILEEDACRDLIQKVHETREFSPNLFLTEKEVGDNPSHSAVNPYPGRNLTEKFDLSWIEKNPVFIESLTRVLGEGFHIYNKKFVVGMPDAWLPAWVARQTKTMFVPNLGAFVKPEYRDMTYFNGIDFHQDMVDHRDRISDFVTLYVYLEDTNNSTSPLFIIPNSHKFGATLFPHKIVVEKHARKLIYTDDQGRKETFDYQILTGPGGTVYFWSALTLHGTQPHRSEKPRISLRYKIEKGNDGQTGLLDTLNDNVVGPLSLKIVRNDCDEGGYSIKTGENIIRGIPL